MKILILKPSSLGDVVQALPVLRLLRRHFPAGEIYWWIDTLLAPLLEGDPDLTGIIPFERRRWAEPRNWRAFWRNLLWARAKGFDWVIDLQGLLRSGTFGWLVNGELFVGLDEPREGARGFYDVIVRRPSFHTHAVDWYLGVLPPLGIPVERDFEWLPPHAEAAKRLRQQWPLDDEHWIALQPGARWPNKRWPSEHFAALVRLLSVRDGSLRFVILGGAADRELGQTIAQANPKRCLDLTGRLSLPEMIECLRRSALMVTNDTGPMHVAAALRKPVVGLFGPTEPRRTGPYGQVEHALRLDLPCAPCFKSRCAWAEPFECLRALSPEAVAAVAQKRMALRGFAACHGRQAS